MDMKEENKEKAHKFEPRTNPRKKIFNTISTFKPKANFIIDVVHKIIKIIL